MGVSDMNITKIDVLRLMVKSGGSVSLHPIIETGAYPVCMELVAEGLAVLSGTEHGIGTVTITELGKEWVRSSGCRA